MTVFVMTLALVLDYFFGELPNRMHPLVGFGYCANTLERWFNQQRHADLVRFAAGLLSLLLLVMIPVALLVLLLMVLPIWANLLLQTIVLYFCIGWQSLREHALSIAQPLGQGDTEQARHALSMIVSRETSTLNETQIAAATIESVLENGNDALFASLFWFALLGAPAALAHRLVNTLDGMWGYRNDRFEYFGKATARLDDILSYLPARLTALSYALLSHHPKQALTCWWRQASKHDSPNAGVVMATGAGALAVRLGGSACYHGVHEKRPLFGWQRKPMVSDIDLALRLIHKGLLLWLVVLAALWL
jgi:adenosylcobinamide-phosphate synthase